jgi:hypothetical protein
MRTILLFVIALCCPGLLAQQVVATAGGTLGNAGGSISYTIGEGVAQTLTHGDKTITEGFHQTSLTVKIVSELIELDFTITVSPNPASDILKIKVTKENVSGLQYSLSDIYGKLIFRKNIESDETIVTVNQLKAGLYILVITEGTKELKTFKIIKE